VGSTGIALASLSKAKGYTCHIVLPNDQAQEKYQLLEVLGAEVEKVMPVSIVDRENQFVNLAKKRAEGREDGKGFFADQFENRANFEAHYRTTGSFFTLSLS
jgi:cysteine synthase A